MLDDVCKISVRWKQEEYQKLKTIAKRSPYRTMASYIRVAIAEKLLKDSNSFTGNGKIGRNK
jgi:predicted DNA-binding protein